MRRRWLLMSLLVATILAVPPAAVILGQVRLQSGAALDANLQLGSGGYNSRGRGAVGQRNTARLYRPAYTVSRPHSVRRDYYNTMWADRHYNVARSVGGYGWGYGVGYAGASPHGFTTPSVIPTPATSGVTAPAGAVPDAAAGPDAEPAAGMMEQISYGIGFYLGKEIAAGLDRDRVGADPDDLIMGFSEGLRELEPRMSREQMEAILAALDVNLRDRMVAQLLAGDPAFKRLHDENLARSRAFHETFGLKEGVFTLPSGIQYEILEVGTGESPGPTDTVVINIRVSHIDGTEIARWDAAEVQIDKMVAAGAQVLPLMKVGARWRTAIPPHLAYGAAGDPPAIGPNETILAEVKLLEIKGP
ncbi:MAG: FKBP-type peptidyl-prolyl cis-trans isomerase N-terminal domain-containing protein [Planctomycetota bacterium]|jgi:FKBP-type peptidyl-prolyl cis-trans isomerase